MTSSPIKHLLRGPHFLQHDLAFTNHVLCICLRLGQLSAEGVDLAFKCLQGWNLSASDSVCSIHGEHVRSLIRSRSIPLLTLLPASP